MLENPYFTTQLNTTVLLQPYQMNNGIYINLKKNLESKVMNKCFKNYGYVVKVIEIKKYGDAIIEAENSDASALFSLQFSCKICLPMKNMTIVCQIQKYNKMLMIATNGPISIMITNNRINENIFYKDNNNNIRYKCKNNESKLLGVNDFIKVTIQTVKLYDGDDKITCIGFLSGTADDVDIESYYMNMYKEDDVIDHDAYIKQHENVNVVNEDNIDVSDKL